MRAKRPSRQSELESDGADAKQHTPILKPYRIPHEHLGRTTIDIDGSDLDCEARLGGPLRQQPILLNQAAHSPAFSVFDTTESAP